MRFRILLIEDDREVRDYLKETFADNDYCVTCAADGERGLALAEQGSFDTVVLDRMLPGMDGLSLLARLRAHGNQTPVLILSALGDVDHRVQGLRAGGDDYLPKPFDRSELIARIEALCRRQDIQRATTALVVHDLRLDLIERRVTRGEKRIHLQPREFRLLEYLMRHQGQTVTRSMLLEHVWGYRFDPQTNVIDVHISRLRNKIDRGFTDTLLHTVRGQGYKLDAA